MSFRQRLCFVLLLLTITVIHRPSPVFASSTHLVINFAQMNELNWTAPEEQWQRDVKPKVEKEVSEMRNQIQGASNRETSSTSSLVPILGWSTLLEYMNFPMDTPSDQSPYVIKVRRIMEVAQDLDFPVFLPLNGFQWWDQLPELYNWWDPDGTHTDARFFARQKNPEEFKARFIAGYDPDNQWNVDWMTTRTPMKLNYRNWGGGGFVLAPPPNLVDNPQAPVRYRKVQAARLTAIVKAIEQQRDEWRQQGKEHLFIGLSIGTEVSLNASATPADEFKPYGYRAVEDLKEKQQSQGLQTSSLHDERVEVVRSYLEDNARLMTRIGIPKDAIYTHVLGEQDPSDAHFGGVAQSAFNLYSNPGVSLYGYAKNPTGSAEWNTALAQAGNPSWGILEYNAGDSASDWQKGLSQAVRTANLTVIYNWDGLSPNAIPAIKSSLAQSLPAVTCGLSPTLHIQNGIVARLGNPEVAVATTSALPHGIYTSFTESTCTDGKKVYGQPQTFYVPLPPVVDTTPGWVKTVLRFTEAN